MNDTTPEAPKLSWWRRLSSGLKRTSSSLGTAVADLVTKRKLDRAMLDDIEDVLLRADLGTDGRGADRGRRRHGALRQGDLGGRGQGRRRRPKSRRCWRRWQSRSRSTRRKKPFVILVVGVNGSGKTTTIGKLAAKFAAEGRKVMLAAGDTFRAAAIEQLKVWGERTRSAGHRRRAGLGFGEPRLQRADRGEGAGASTCC